jgi:hypothetical protein
MDKRASLRRHSISEEENNFYEMINWSLLLSIWKIKLEGMFIGKSFSLI